MDENEKLLKIARKMSKKRLNEEQQVVEAEQEKLRERRDDCETELRRLNEEIKAKLRNGEDDTALEKELKLVEAEIDRIDAKMTRNAEMLEIYSKVVKNRRDGGCGIANAVTGAVTGVASALGIALALGVDREGGLVDKTTLQLSQFFSRKNKH